MLEMLEKFFENARGRKLVAIEFLRLGLKVDGKGKIYAGNIELPPAKIGRALSVDRRVVIETAKAIADDDKLLQIFYRLESRAFMGNAARELGFDVIELRADPKKKGIVASVTKVLADAGIVIRQIISDDPDLFPDPVLTIIIDGKLSSRVIKTLKELKFADSIMIK
ncbi:MAG: amino acid-binding ACT domain protein [Candidatus Micrarchaeota archaeon]|nr:amino acid-binding ACT domain protein [Candidatus Micrarchaeota archaeon]